MTSTIIVAEPGSGGHSLANYLHTVKGKNTLYVEEPTEQSATLDIPATVPAGTLLFCSSASTRDAIVSRLRGDIVVCSFTRQDISPFGDGPLDFFLSPNEYLSDVYHSIIEKISVGARVGPQAYNTDFDPVVAPPL